MNKAMFKSIMALYGDTVNDVADFLGLTPQSVYNKMNETEMPSGKNAEFGQREIRLLSERYKLTAKQIKEVFFN